MAKTCMLCGQELSAGQSKYCGQKCRDKARYERRKTIPKTCLYCGIDYLASSHDQKFCSVSCNAAFQNKGKMGPASRRWRGGRLRRQDGYVRVYEPDNPMAHKDGYVYEHRLEAGKKYGFLKYPSELTTHHLNGIKDDNRPENLKIIRSQAEHLKKYHKE